MWSPGRWCPIFKSIHCFCPLIILVFAFSIPLWLSCSHSGNKLCQTEQIQQCPQLTEFQGRWVSMFMETSGVEPGSWVTTLSPPSPTPRPRRAESFLDSPQAEEQWRAGLSAWRREMKEVLVVGTQAGSWHQGPDGTPVPKLCTK